MARIGNSKNLLTFLDPLSQGADGKPTRIGLFYRFPSTEERQDYFNNLQYRDDDSSELVDQALTTRVEFGLKILTGFTEESFEDALEDGSIVPVSSDPASEHYRADWKNIVEQTAADIVSVLAMQVFERSAIPLPRTKSQAESTKGPGKGPGKGPRKGSGRRKTKSTRGDLDQD